MALHASTYEPKSRFAKWMDVRLPVGRLMHTQFVDFPTPRNLNYWWTFGSILTFFLMAQIVTGVVLAMHYQPSAAEAFDSVEAIRRDVNYGWLMRNLHAVGASMFFLAGYIHIFRGLYYGSYKSPREVLWIIGVLIFLTMMATAFMGYSLPWGQMSFWAVTVITNLFSSLDSIYSGLGTTIVEWLWGGYSVSRRHPQPLLQPALPAAVRDRGPRRPAPVGLASRRPEQPHRPRRQDAVGCGADAPLCDVEGCGRYVRLPDPLRLVRVLPARLPRAIPTTTSRPTRWSRRRTSCRSGTSCPTTPSCARSLRSCWASPCCLPPS